jgi:hypothetical protein
MLEPLENPFGTKVLPMLSAVTHFTCRQLNAREIRATRIVRVEGGIRGE